MHQLGQLAADAVAVLIPGGDQLLGFLQGAAEVLGPGDEPQALEAAIVVMR